MAYLIPFLLFVFGHIFPRNRYLTFFFLLYFWVLMGLNTYTPDYESYEDTYNNLFLYPQYEIGFQGLCALGNIWGLSYQEFRMLFAALFVLFTYISATRISPYPNYILALFLLWPFVPSVSGIRQVMANIIMCCGIPCLYKPGKAQLIKYLFWVLLAWTIHISALFYIVFIFARNEFGVKEKRMLFFTIVIVSLILSGSGLLGGLLQSLGNHKFDKWLNINGDEGIPRPNFAGFIIRTFLVCLYAYIVPCIKNIIHERTDSRNISYMRTMVCSNISILLLLIIPGFIVAGEYQRYMYGAMFIYYAVYADFYYGRIAYRCKNRAQILLISYFAILLTIWYYWFSTRNHDLIATFTDNLLFQ